MMVFALIFSLHGGAYATEARQPTLKVEEKASELAPAKEEGNEKEKPSADQNNEQIPKKTQEDKKEVQNQTGEKSSDQTSKTEEKSNEVGQKEENLRKASPKTESQKALRAASPQASPMGAPSGESGGESGEGQTNPPDKGKGSEPTKPEEKKDPSPEVDVKTNEDLKKLDEQMKNEKDPKKKAELEKEYNKKYAELLEESGKLDDTVLDRVKDKDRTNRYYELKAEYEAILEKLKKENPNSQENKKLREELDKLNKELGKYKIPRLLEDDEKGQKRFD